MVDHLGLEARLGGYEAEAAVAERLDGVRASVARLLGCGPDEVALTGSDTEGWTKAVWGLALGGGLPAGCRVLVDHQSYDSHYLGLLQVCRVTGPASASFRRRPTAPSISRPWTRSWPPGTWPW